MRNKSAEAEISGFNAGLVPFLQMFGTDAACREYLEARRWPNGPECAHCESDQVYDLKGKSTRPGLYKCAKCRKPFTVTMGTIFESSHIPLPKWFAAIYLMCTSKKGISAHQIHRTLAVTYKTAWFMCHRIRHAMKNPKFTRTLMGTVEADETYVGGKPRPKHGVKGGGVRGRGSSTKVPLMAIVQRDGPVTAFRINDVKANTVNAALRSRVYPDATIMTDQFVSYKFLYQYFKGGHETVNHSIGQYVDGNAHTNTVESFFALLKRGIHGTFHHVSPKHLTRYAGEFSFRWTNRKLKDGARVEEAFGGFDGVRLMYRTLIGN